MSREAENERLRRALEELVLVASDAAEANARNGDRRQTMVLDGFRAAIWTLEQAMSDDVLDAERPDIRSDVAATLARWGRSP